MKIRLATLLLCLAVTGACARQTLLLDASPPGPASAMQTVDDLGISFEYPGSWVTFAAEQGPEPEGPSGQGGQGAPGSDRLYLKVVGVDGLNFVDVQIRQLPLPAEGLTTWDGVRAYWGDFFGANHARVVSGPDEVRMAGLTGLQWEALLPTGVGYVASTTLVVVVQGTREYSVRCQHIPDHAEEIGRGCQAILASLHIFAG